MKHFEMKSTKAIASLFLILTLFSSCQKEVSQQSGSGQLMNPSFESSLDGWQVESQGGFTASSVAAQSGQLGLQFTAPSEAWNGKIYQTIQNLPDGNYSFTVYAKAAGSGMYLWADGGSGAVTTPIQPAYLDSVYSLPLNTLNFAVTGGVAKVGFICIEASSDINQQPSAILEAESAVLNKAVVASNRAGFTGTGFVDFINSTGDFIEWTYNKTDSGSVALQFRYANGSTADRPLKLEVNNVEINPGLAFPPTGDWANWSAALDTVHLTKGSNTNKLSSIGFNGSNIDHLALRNVLLAPYFYADDAQLAKLP
jgi:hypothetical protein